MGLFSEEETDLNFCCWGISKRLELDFVTIL